MAGSGRHLSLPQQLQRSAGDHLCSQPQRHLQTEEDLGQSLQTGPFPPTAHVAINPPPSCTENTQIIVFLDKGTDGQAAEDCVFRGEIQKPQGDTQKVNIDAEQE